MRSFFGFVGAAVVVACLVAPSDAEACGGTFLTQGQKGEVAGHRMIFSISKSQTTLWDEISYTGEPTGFAWVLPIHGKVEVGASSDFLFKTIDQGTAVTVTSPSIFCPDCNDGSGGGNGGGMSTTEMVEVLAKETIGPFDTVQVSSPDPAALENWLIANGYSITDDMKPIIAAYVSEGFDFLALKLSPGKGVDAMQPVRVTTPGAGLSLPLRMVAAGTGPITPINLFIMSEGRYEPTNFPTVKIDTFDLVWNWDTKSSNYATLVHDTLLAKNGNAWLLESSFPVTPAVIEGTVLTDVEKDPAASGYGKDAASAKVAALADLKALYGSLDPNSVWVTRLHAELPKALLATDLVVGAAANQNMVSPYLDSFESVGKPPECPPLNCGGDGGGGTGGSSTSSGTGGNGGAAAGGSSGSAGKGGGGAGGGAAGNGNNGSNAQGGCTIQVPESSAGAGAAAGVAIGLIAALRRRRSGKKNGAR